MIDRSAPVFLLRPKVLLGAAGISGAAFSLLLAFALLCLIAGGIVWTVCWIAYICLLVGGYGVVVAAAVIPVGVVGAAAKKGENVGCASLLALVALIAILSNGLPWMSGVLSTPERVLVGAEQATGLDDEAWSACVSSASYLVTELFIGYQVYLYSWTALAIVLTGAGISLSAVALLRLERPFKSVFRRIRYRCKHCGGTNLRYRCPGPGCTVWHDDLRPTVYGVMAATCGRCKTKLPTIDLLGRSNLPQTCANLRCSGAVDAGMGGISEYHFAVVGAQSSGKSCYLFATVWKFVEFAAVNGWTVDFPDPAQKKDYDDYVRLFQAGRTIPKTISRERPFAFTLDVASISGARSRLYMYDAAGEDFEAGDVAASAHGMGSFDFFKYVDGIFFVVDPMSEEEAGAKRAENNHSRFDSSFMISQLLPVLQRAQQTASGRRIPVPVAVVVTKAEVAVLKNDSRTLFSTLVGPDQLRRCESIEQASSDATADSLTVRGFLSRVGADDVVRLMEASFFDVRFFAVSALGRGAGGAGAFTPQRVLQPLLWLTISSGALTDEMVASRLFRHAADYLSRVRRGQEGAPLQISLWAITITGVSGVGGACWYLGGPLLATIGALAAVILPVVAIRLTTHGLRDVDRARSALGRFRRWFVVSLTGANGRSAQLIALGLISLAIAAVAAIGFAAFP
jgi:hypothetical protein